MVGSASLAPFNHRLFAWLWTGNTISALGTWIQSTASAWLMTDLAPDPLMVGLIQAASQLPILLFAIPAGALADTIDRRRLLIWTNLGMLGVSGTLALLSALDLVDTVVLLALTAALACFSAMNSPAWASSVPLTVPRADVPQALVLNSIGFNLARALGPAIGGVIVAASGAAVAFGINAISFAIVAILVGFVLVIPQSHRTHGLPPEPIRQAIGLGLRYATAEPVLRAALVRSAAFYAGASAIWALLPLYVRDVLGLGATAYGIMLGAMGAGAVVGGLVMPVLRARIARDTLVMAAGLVTSLAAFPIALAPTPMGAGFAMFVFGIGWIVGASNLQATVQLACAPWVRARGIAIYQAVFNAGMGLGAIAWGWLGTYAGLNGTILAAGLGGIVFAVLGRSQQLPAVVADPSLPASRPMPSVAVHSTIAPLLEAPQHPVLVTVIYIVDPVDNEAFVVATEALRPARLRDGAVAWLLARDVEHPERWIETFRLPNWDELRRGMARMNVADDEAVQRVRAFHRGTATPAVHVFVVN